MSLEQIDTFFSQFINDKVNLTNIIGFTFSFMLKPLQSMHEISLFAKDITPILGAFTALSLFAYNAKKFYNEFKNKKE